MTGDLYIQSVIDHVPSGLPLREQIAIQGDGRIVHLKGQVALDRNGTIVGAGDMRVQLRQVLENIRTALASVGGNMEDILSMTSYVTDMDEFLAASDVRRAFFASRCIVAARRMSISRNGPSVAASSSPSGVRALSGGPIGRAARTTNACSSGTSRSTGASQIGVASNISREG